MYTRVVYSVERHHELILLSLPTCLACLTAVVFDSRLQAEGSEARRSVATRNRAQVLSEKNHRATVRLILDAQQCSSAVRYTAVCTLEYTKYLVHAHAHELVCQMFGWKRYVCIKVACNHAR